MSIDHIYKKTNGITRLSERTLEMTKFTTKTKILALALTTCSALALGTVAEAETLTSNADVTVQNAIGFAETSALTFGTIVAIGDGTAGGAAATIAAAATGVGGTTVTNGGAAADDSIIELTAGARAEYAISAAAPNTALNLTLPSGALTLTCAACSGGTPTFSVDNWVANDTAGTVTTDGTGAFTLYVGATLNTDPTSLSQYEDGNYINTYDVSVNY